LGFFIEGYDEPFLIPRLESERVIRFISMSISAPLEQVNQESAFLSFRRVCLADLARMVPCGPLLGGFLGQYR